MNNERRVIRFRIAQLQHTFRHASDFGVGGAQNKHTLAAFEQALQSHVISPATTEIKGYYRNQAVTHFVNCRTGLNVMLLPGGDYLSGWLLSPMQLHHVLSTGKLGGGKS